MESPIASGVVPGENTHSTRTNVMNNSIPIPCPGETPADSPVMPSTVPVKAYNTKIQNLFSVVTITILRKSLCPSFDINTKV